MPGARAERKAAKGPRPRIRRPRLNVPQAWRPLVAPGLILVAATLALWLGPSLPASLAGLQALGPYAVLGAAVAVAFTFNRGRSLILAGTLLAAFFAYRYAISAGPLAGKAVYSALSVLVPLNALAVLVGEERGVRHHGAWRWLVVLAVEALLVAWIVAATRGAAPFWAPALDHWALRSPPTPLLGRLAFAVAIAVAAWRAWPRHTPLEMGFAASLVAFFIACEFRDAAAVFNGFFAVAGALLLVALLQESYRLAFYDELTGVPGRRALQERLRALGTRYTIAMVDVDHFKQFNDTHGHDVGDQVLKLVAARLTEVEGGGFAYRYGGEEFSVLFPDKGIDEALPALDAIRASIESYRMAVRAKGRPKDPQEGTRQRGAGVGSDALSVTVSIGVAERGGRHSTPDKVMKAADAALYRAKQAGRNRVMS